MGILAFFRRLAADPAANVIVISAVALVPLLGMVGGAVDASRYYMTSARLQAACDAGALAGRRAMDDPAFDDSEADAGKFTAKKKEQAELFFDTNYEDTLFGLEKRTRTFTASDDGIVTGTASGELPTSLMYIFGYQQFDINVTCSADVNVANTDVMFVVDVTGSMNCPADSATACGGGGSNNGVEYQDAGVNASRIEALRNSVLDFYDVVEEATSPSAQVRYGVLPYSSAVNVGRDLNSSWMATSADYQSRTSGATPPNWVSNGIQSSNRTSNYYNVSYIGRPTVHFSKAQSFSQCSNNAGKNHWDIIVEEDFDLGDLTQTSQTVSGNTRTTTYSGEIRWRVYFDYKGGGYYNGPGQCFLPFDEYEYDAIGTVTVTETDIANSGSGSTSEYEYKQITWDVSSLYGQDEGSLPTGVLGQISLQTGLAGAMQNHNWYGCIEEAETVTGADFDPVPSGAYDINIDLVPTSTQEKWKPSLPSAVYYRYDDGTPFPYGNGSNWVLGEQNSTENKITPVSTSIPGQSFNPFDAGWYACPVPAQKLTEIDGATGTLDRSGLSDYLDSLRAKGATYHDFGMLWGARYISPDGIFASENSVAPNGDAISRHIIFMTDGKQATSRQSYGLYGVEGWDRRVTGDGSEASMETNHAARFQAACEAARKKNISVWVVAFGTDLTSNLTNCATAGRSFKADNAEQLKNTFKEIAEKIADLRLTQ